MRIISPAIVVELKKVPTWNTLSASQNPFHLIQMLSRVCQTDGFDVLTGTQLEEIKQYQQFAKFEQRKDVQSFHEEMSSQYDTLITTRNKLSFEANVMSDLLVAYGLD